MFVDFVIRYLYTLAKNLTIVACVIFFAFSLVSPKSDKLHKYKHAAVATDHPECSTIGRNILHRGGSAVDSAIASMLCLGVVHPHSTGIGGGGFMLVYHRFTKFSEMIDFRENAPLLANKDMFHGDLMKAILGRSQSLHLKFKLRNVLYRLGGEWKFYCSLKWSNSMYRDFSRWSCRWRSG